MTPRVAVMKAKWRCLLTLLVLWPALAACRNGGPETDSAAEAQSGRPGRGRLQPLDEQHAAAFRAAFDDSKDHDRYVVALSPT